MDSWYVLFKGTSSGWQGGWRAEARQELGSSQNASFRDAPHRGGPGNQEHQHFQYGLSSVFLGSGLADYARAPE